MSDTSRETHRVGSDVLRAFLSIRGTGRSRELAIRDLSERYGIDEEALARQLEQARQAERLPSEVLA